MQAHSTPPSKTNTETPHQNQRLEKPVLVLNCASGTFVEVEVVNVYGAASSSNVPRREILGTRPRSRSRLRDHGVLEGKNDLKTDAHRMPRDVNGALEELTQPPAAAGGLVPVDFTAEEEQDWVDSSKIKNEGADKSSVDKEKEEATDTEDEEPEPHLTAWRTTHAEQGKFKRAYLTAHFKGDGRHMVVEVSENQTSEYKLALFELMEQATTMNYTKEQTVAERNRLLREGRWLPGLNSARPAADSTSDLE